MNDTIRKAMRLTNTERARQLALRREQLATTMGLLEPDPAVIGRVWGFEGFRVYVGGLRPRAGQGLRVRRGS